ncbi:MAG: aldose epimerase family protein [Duganella sp.]
MSISLVAMLAAGAQAAPGITVTPFGATSDGRQIDKVVLENSLGMRLALIDFGATVLSAEVADRDGQRRNVILGLPDVKSFEQTPRQYGSIVGRYAGRIGGARYTLGGKTVQLQANPSGSTLHGGPIGYDHRVWQRERLIDADADVLGVVYRLHSPHGDQKFPGALDIRVTYRLLRDSDEFQIEYQATTDRPTVLNLTNHAYFNLAGAAAGAAAMRDHRIAIDADRTTETDSKQVPTGRLLPVAGTPLDLRQLTDYWPRLQALDGGFDHSFVLSRAAGKLARAAVVEHTVSGRRLEVYTTEPSLQLYSGGGFNGKEIGSEGVGYQQYGGFALETQHLPDSPNQPHFPSTALYPGQTFKSLTIYRFSTIGKQ